MARLSHKFCCTKEILHVMHNHDGHKNTVLAMAEAQKSLRNTRNYYSHVHIVRLNTTQYVAMLTLCSLLYGWYCLAMSVDCLKRSACVTLQLAIYNSEHTFSYYSDYTFCLNAQYVRKNTQQKKHHRLYSYAYMYVLYL